MLGTKIGRFLVLEELGRGGMATVWKARDELMGRVVAVKVLDKLLSGAPSARRGFRREAEIAALLEHPSIVPVYEAGEFEESAYLVMKLIQGETLARFASRRLPPPRDVLRVAAAATDALGYAHSRGVIHRDVTPRNIMLTESGGVYVLDFGLARIAGASASSSGHIAGTPAYLAPETLRGLPADARSDIYGLGVVMYEALTGTLPFAGDRPEVFCYNILNGTAEPPSRLRPELGPDLDALVMRMLSRDPAGRPATAQELGTELTRALSPSGGGARHRAPRRRGARGATPAASEAAQTRTEPPPARSMTAERLAHATGPVYLAVPEFEARDRDAKSEGATRELARALGAAAAAAVTGLQRLHVVVTEIAPPSRSRGALRAYARGIGANLVLLGSVRRSGTRARVTYVVVDPEAGMQIAGDALDGSTLDAFELEDRLLASLRRALARTAGGPSDTSRARPGDPAAAEHYQQALRYMERHDHEAHVDGAIAILERLIESEGDVAAYHAALARACLFKYGLTKQRTWESRAAATGARAAEIAPDAAETLLALGDLHRVAGRFADAEREYGLALAQRPDYYEALLGRARALEELGQVEEAVKQCEETVARRPDDWRGHSLLGRLNFDHGRYAAAVEPWRRMAQLAPDSALAAFNLGSALYHMDRIDDAIAEYQRSIKIRPNADAFWNLGTVLHYLGRHDEAEVAFEKAVALAPSNAWGWGNLGNALRQMPGREARAKEALERAVGLMREQLGRNPADAKSWGRLAGWLANLGQSEPAGQAIRRALELSPSDVHCMVHAVHVYHQLGDRAACLHWTGAAVEHGYSAESLRRDPELASMRDDPDFVRRLEARPRPPAPRTTGEVGGSPENGQEEEGREKEEADG